MVSISFPAGPSETIFKENMDWHFEPFLEAVTVNKYCELQGLSVVKSQDRGHHEQK